MRIQSWTALAAALLLLGACGSEPASDGSNADVSGEAANGSGPGGQGDTGTGAPDTPGGGTDTGAPPGTPPPPDFDGSTPPITPVAGIWHYARGNIEDNSCGGLAMADDNTFFLLEAAGTGRFVIDQSEPWGRFDCFVMGERFECPRRAVGSEPISGTNVTLHYQVAVQGVIQSETHIQGSQRVSVECEGSQCEMATMVVGFGFPCGWSIPFEVSFRLGGSP